MSVVFVCVCICLIGATSANMSSCGKKTWSAYGKIYSHKGYNKNQNYTNNLYCTWSVFAPNKKFVLLQLNRFSLQDSNNCNSDSLTIYDGSDLSSPVIEKVCGGRREGKFIFSAGRSVTLKFSTDDAVTDKGFRIRYFFGDEDKVCPTRPQSLQGSNGVILSHPAAGNKNYSQFLDCTWIVEGLPGKVVKLQFDYFNLREKKEFECVHEKLTVYDGGDVHSKIIANLCGSDLPADITSSGQRLMLRFKSNWRSEGFKLRYKLVKRKTTSASNFAMKLEVSFKLLLGVTLLSVIQIIDFLFQGSIWMMY